MNPSQLVAFDSCLVRIARGLLGRIPLAQTLELIREQRRRPTALTLAGSNLLKRALSQGTIEQIVRSGWRPARGLQQRQIMLGRVWDRYSIPNLQLEFTSSTLEFLLWLTTDVRQAAVSPQEHVSSPPVVGDALYQLFAYARLRDTPIQAVLQRWPAVGHNALALLHFPSELTHHPLQRGEVDWSFWITGPGTWCLETLQWQLAETWESSEHQKLENWGQPALLQMASDQQAVLDAVYQHLGKECRFDLSRFLLLAAERLLADDAYRQGLRRRVAETEIPEDRVRQALAATVTVRQLQPLHDWERRARQVGYHDVGYPQAQLWLAEWEAHEGSLLCARLDDLLNDILGATSGADLRREHR